MAKRVNSQHKGARTELALCRYLKSLGFPGFRRTAQRCGKNGDAPDVVSDESLTGLHIECKADGGIDLGTRALEAAMEQADRDAPNGKNPVVFWKPNHKAWRLSWWDSTAVTLTVCGDGDIRETLISLNGGSK